MQPLSRRQIGLGTLGVFAGTGCASEPSPSDGPLIVSAQGDEAALYALTGTTTDGVVASLTTGFRGHGAAAHPRRSGVVALAARSPGTTLLLADLPSGAELARIEAESGTHFLGHAAFSADGEHLYTTEADIEAGVGLVGVRDAESLALLEHYPSHGVGPHELRLMPDGETLVIANGGILTHPDTGEEKLNLDTMESILSYVDRRTGALLDEYRLAEPKASIRHLAITSDGTVAVGLQVQREVMTATDPVALGARHRRGEPLELFVADGLLWRSFDDYVGSVAIHEGHDVVGLSSPRGNRVGFWRLSTGAFLAEHEMVDVCGLAGLPNDRYFALTSSLGQVRFIDVETLTEDRTRRLEDPSLRWDNHLITLVTG